jgi:adenosylcobinamide kinase / adenosylcobinamide-phosphate guanylyltransferase
MIISHVRDAVQCSAPSFSVGAERRVDTPHLTLVLGGARSGKSRHAEALIEALPPPWTYIATAQAYDDEMRTRIAEHRARRSDSWTTIESPLALPEAIRQVPASRPILVDCLTLWLTNLILAEHDVAAASAKLIAVCAASTSPIVLVSNEVGLGIVPENALARRFRDEAGRLHQQLAAKADRVVFMVAGLPMQVK